MSCLDISLVGTPNLLNISLFTILSNYAIYNKHIGERYKISLQYKELLIPYNPWWENPDKAFERLPLFHRPIFDEIFKGFMHPS